MKSITTISIESENQLWARENIDNFSGWVDEKIEQLKKSKDVTPERYEEASKNVIEIDQAITKITEARKAWYIRKIELKRELNKKKFSDLAELQNLTPEQKANNQFHISLVDLLRKKYPETLGRVDVKDLVEYFSNQDVGDRDGQ
jgi:hypothetical protein